MQRRSVLAAGGSLTLLGVGAYTQLRTNEPGTPPDHDPLTFDVVAGAPLDELTIPIPDQVTVLDIFATSCSVCADGMPDLGALHQTAPDDVQLVSLTAEPTSVTTNADIREWWDRYNGSWPAVRDPSADLTRHYRQATPTAVVFDANGYIQWEHTGRKSLEELQTAIDDAR